MRTFFQGSGFLPKGSYAGRQNMFTDFMSFLDALTPMIFASLSVAVAMKCGLFNICVSGMMLAAGFEFRFCLPEPNQSDITVKTGLSCLTAVPALSAGS